MAERIEEAGPDPARAFRVISERHFERYYQSSKGLFEAFSRLDQQEQSELETAVTAANREQLQNDPAAQDLMRRGMGNMALAGIGVDVPSLQLRLDRLGRTRNSLFTALPPSTSLLTVAPSRDLSRILTGESRPPYPFVFDRSEADPSNPRLENNFDWNLTDKEQGVIGTVCDLACVTRIITGDFSVRHDCAVLTGQLPRPTAPTQYVVQFTVTPQAGNAFVNMFDGERGVDTIAFIAASQTPFVAVHSSPLISPLNSVYALPHPGFHTQIWQRQLLAGGWVNKSWVTEDKPWDTAPVTLEAMTGLIQPSDVPDGLCIAVGVRHSVVASIRNMRFLLHSAGTWRVDVIDVFQA